MDAQVVSAKSVSAKSDPLAKSEPKTKKKVVDQQHPPKIVYQYYFDSLGNECKIQWNVGKFIGKGGFSSVYSMCNNDTKELFAGKFILISSMKTYKTKERLGNEIRLHRSLSASDDSSKIVKFINYFETDDYYVIVMELCENKSMRELIKARKNITEAEARYYLWQIVESLEYIHKNMILHHDLKLGNILLTKDLKIKICDFGLAEKLGTTTSLTTKMCGTPNYIAPEVIKKQAHSYPADIWALGVLLYTFLIGTPPFETNSVQMTYGRIKESLFYFPSSKSVLSSDAKDLITKILKVDPDERLCLSQIKTHSFFKEYVLPEALPTISLYSDPKLSHKMTDRLTLLQEDESGNTGSSTSSTTITEISSESSLNDTSSDITE
jgi:serine/threonine protein kinase